MRRKARRHGGGEARRRKINRMGLFKSKEQRRIEREMKIRAGLRSIEKSIREQEKFSEDFIKNAQHARKKVVAA